MPKYSRSTPCLRVQLQLSSWRRVKLSALSTEEIHVAPCTSLLRSKYIMLPGRNSMAELQRNTPNGLGARALVPDSEDAAPDQSYSANQLPATPILTARTSSFYHSCIDHHGLQICVEKSSLQCEASQCSPYHAVPMLLLFSPSQRGTDGQAWQCPHDPFRIRVDPGGSKRDQRCVDWRYTGWEEDADGSCLAVGAVFSSVASSYDAMNDLMSLGIHRLWKDHFVRSLNPGSPLASREGDVSGTGWNILDIAGGTGDIAFRLLDHATNINNDRDTRVTVADINPDMLAEGRKRSIDTPYYNTNRLSFMVANAEHMPTIPDSSVDLYTVAFGIRNFTDKQAALYEAFRVLKPGGVFACMEFSKVNSTLFNEIYKRWSFSAIPLIGQMVAGDRGSYQYLVESIERFPSQEEFRGMIQKAGFMIPGQGFENLSLGIAAIHKGVKPIDKT